MTILTEGVTLLLTPIVIPDDVTVEGLAQTALEVSVQVMTSPLESPLAL
jgi:hypothetical protein